VLISYIFLCVFHFQKKIFLCVEEGHISNGRCGHHARCYVQSLPSGPDHSSNGLTDGISPLLLRLTSTTLKTLVPPRLLYFILTPLYTHSNMAWLKMSNSLLLHPVLLSLMTRVHWYTCTHVWSLARSCGRKEDPVEKILLTIFFVKGREREMRHINNNGRGRLHRVHCY
jgi:hypothetical protein